MEPKRFIKLVCENCSKGRRRIKEYGEKRGIQYPKDFEKIYFELVNDTYYPKVKYQCTNCGKEKIIELEKGAL